MPNQLLLTYSFPPLANAESIVTAKTVKALEGWGWKSTVCSVAPRWNSFQEDWGLLELLPPDVQAHRIAPLPVIKLPRLLRRLGLNYVALVLDSMPDNSIFWYPSALLPLRKILRGRSIGVIHSRAMPLAGHFLGLYAKQKTGLPWLVHFCDPWLDGPLYSSPGRLVTRWHARWERKIFAAADAITFTTEAACATVMSKYPAEWKRKAHVIPHGFVVHRECPAEKRFLDPAFLNIVYLGNFYGTRHPYVLFEALRRLKESGRLDDRLRVWLIGRMPHRQYAEQLQRDGIERQVCLHAAVPYDVARACGHQADVLLMINSVYRDPNFFLESKLIDYLGFHKPIWGIVYPAGQAADVVNLAGGYVADIDRADHVAEILVCIIQDWQAGRLNGRGDFNHPRIQDFRIENTTKKMARLLDAMLAGGSGMP